MVLTKTDISLYFILVPWLYTMSLHLEIQFLLKSLFLTVFSETEIVIILQMVFIIKLSISGPSALCNVLAYNVKYNNLNNWTPGY